MVVVVPAAAVVAPVVCGQQPINSNHQPRPAQVGMGRRYGRTRSRNVRFCWNMRALALVLPCHAKLHKLPFQSPTREIGQLVFSPSNSAKRDPSMSFLPYRRVHRNRGFCRLPSSSLVRNATTARYTPRFSSRQRQVVTSHGTCDKRVPFAFESTGETSAHGAVLSVGELTSRPRGCAMTTGWKKDSAA